LTVLAAVGVSGEGEEGAELLEGAENGRYKVVAKAEPYRNLPVSTCTYVQYHQLRHNDFSF
jgi:hypothetical protein